MWISGGVELNFLCLGYFFRFRVVGIRVLGFMDLVFRLDCEFRGV